MDMTFESFGDKPEGLLNALGQVVLPFEIAG